MMQLSQTINIVSSSLAYRQVAALIQMTEQKTQILKIPKYSTTQMPKILKYSKYSNCGVHGSLGAAAEDYLGFGDLALFLQLFSRKW